MKFDIVTGNPPYQESGDARDEPIYHHFYDLAEKVSNQYCLISPARFLFNAGQTPKSWNDKMLSHENLKVLFYEQNSSNIFPDTDIKGGLTIIYHNNAIKCEPIGIFTHFAELNSIKDKVLKFQASNLSELVQPQGIYRFSSNFFEKFPDAEAMQGKGTKNKIISKSFATMDFAFVKNNDNNEFVKILGLVNGKREYRWINRKYLITPPSFEKWKVILPESNGSGAIGEVLSTPLIGQPLIGHTDTFLTIGQFELENEALNLLKYIKTKFARTMLGILKITQHNSRATWAKVPIQNFTINSDINWEKNIFEIDQQLYKKYGLDKNEIDFIETNVKDME